METNHNKVSMKNSNQAKMVPTISFITKMVAISVFIIGLCNFSVYSASATTASTTTNPARIIPGDSQQYMDYEGLSTEPQPWEDGIRTDPTPNTFEWWYVDATLDDGSSAQFTFLTKPWIVSPLPFDPYLDISITTPNGTTYQDQVHVDTDQFMSARDQANITMGNNWLRGNLTNYELHVESPKGFGADLVFTRDAPSARGGGGSGKTYYDPSLTQYFTWFIPFPSGMVQGNLTYDGQTHEVQGRGYHDHQWGTVDLNKVLDRWYWTRADVGNYTIDAGLNVGSSFYNYQQMPQFYLAKGNQVLINEMDHLTVQGSGNNTSPSGHNYPSELTFTWQNGSDIVRISLSNPKLISSGSSTTVTNATTIGNPEYMRLAGDGVVNVNLAGANETFNFPAIWEVNYGH